MLTLYFTPAALGYLSQCILASLIAGYFVIRFVLRRAERLAHQGLLTGFFVCVALLTFLFTMETATSPAERLSGVDLCLGFLEHRSNVIGLAACILRLIVNPKIARQPTLAICPDSGRFRWLDLDPSPLRSPSPIGLRSVRGGLRKAFCGGLRLPQKATFPLFPP
ncbi:MAG: hypothetical protein N2383_00850 [Caldilineales bacterium]|nr:hypothetical protein [Caldilineales bacterium]